MSKVNTHDSQQDIPSQQPNSSKAGFLSTFSDEEIRVRAYQIYEFRDRNDGHEADDWSQAENELMEMVGGK